MWHSAHFRRIIRRRNPIVFLGIVCLALAFSLNQFYTPVHLASHEHLTTSHTDHAAEHHASSGIVTDEVYDNSDTRPVLRYHDASGADHVVVVSFTQDEQGRQIASVSHQPVRTTEKLSDIPTPAPAENRETGHETHAANDHLFGFLAHVVVLPYSEVYWEHSVQPIDRASHLASHGTLLPLVARGPPVLPG